MSRAPRNEAVSHINEQGVVLFGPSGSGKGRVVGHLLGSTDPEGQIQGEMHPLSVSWTTREPRDGEEDGVHYHFRTQDEFDDMVEQGGFLEYAQYVGNSYGTPTPGKDRGFFVEIEADGVSQVLDRYRNNELEVAKLAIIMIVPANLGELAMRLFNRKDGMDPEKKLRRLQAFETELQWGLETPECVFISNPPCDNLEQQGALAAEGLWAVLADREHPVITDKDYIAPFFSEDDFRVMIERARNEWVTPKP